MKLRELIARVDKSDVNRSPVYVGALAEQMEIEDVHKWDDVKRLTAYWLMKWYDSGNYCGLQVVFLDGEPVAIWTIPYGKSDGEVEWLSAEAYNKTRAYVLSFQELYESAYAIANQDEECGEGYSLQYNEQLMDCHTKGGHIGGEPVQVFKPNPGAKRDIMNHTVSVVGADNKQRKVSLREVKYPYHIEPKTGALGEF